MNEVFPYIRVITPVLVHRSCPERKGSMNLSNTSLSCLMVQQLNKCVVNSLQASSSSDSATKEGQARFIAMIMFSKVGKKRITIWFYVRSRRRTNRHDQYPFLPLPQYVLMDWLPQVAQALNMAAWRPVRNQVQTIFKHFLMLL
jgi:hypothetical protein